MKERLHIKKILTLLCIVESRYHDYKKTGRIRKAIRVGGK